MRLNARCDTSQKLPDVLLPTRYVDKHEFM